MRVKVFEGTGREIEYILNDWLGSVEVEVFHIGQTQNGDLVTMSVFYRKAE